MKLDQASLLRMNGDASMIYDLICDSPGGISATDIGRMCPDMTLGRRMSAIKKLHVRGLIARSSDVNQHFIWRVVR